MISKLHLTYRDQNVLLALTQKVPLLALRQLSDHWWDGQLANTRRRMNALARSGLLKRMTVMARTLPPIENPLASWQPGQPVPACGELAYQLQDSVAAIACCGHFGLCGYAARRRLVGGQGYGRLKRPLQATHDLGVAATWLRLHRMAPPWADAWRGEDLMAHTRRGEKLPDAFILSDRRGGAVGHRVRRCLRHRPRAGLPRRLRQPRSSLPDLVNADAIHS